MPPHVIELDHNRLNEQEAEYTAVIVGRDLASYLTALILKQRGHRVAIVSQSKAPVMMDLYEHLSLKYLHEAARRFRAMRSLSTKGLQYQSDETMSLCDWKQLTNACKREFVDRKQHFENEVVEKGIAIYEGSIVMVEEKMLRVITEDQLEQVAALRTQCVILGSDICRCTMKDYAHQTNEHGTLRTLVDMLSLEQIPKRLTVIGGGAIGVAVASCMKDLGCAQVTIIERQSHCLVDSKAFDRDVTSYIESALIHQQIKIITNYTVRYLTEAISHAISDPVETDCRFVAIGARRTSHPICHTPTTAIIQLIERVSFGRPVRIESIVTPAIPIFPMDYQQVKSVCSIEQAVSIAYRTICRCFNKPQPNFVAPSFIYTIHPCLIMGQTRMPADDMIICRVAVPTTMKYVIDTPPRGFGKLWISRTRKILRGVQLISEHAMMFGKAFGILIRNELLLEDLCSRIELPGSIGEGVQLMIKQAMHTIANHSLKP